MSSSINLGWDSPGQANTTRISQEQENTILFMIVGGTLPCIAGLLRTSPVWLPRRVYPRPGGRPRGRRYPNWVCPLKRLLISITRGGRRANDEEFLIKHLNPCRFWKMLYERICLNKNVVHFNSWACNEPSSRQLLRTLALTVSWVSPHDYSENNLYWAPALMAYRVSPLAAYIRLPPDDISGVSPMTTQRTT